MYFLHKNLLYVSACYSKIIRDYFGYGRRIGRGGDEDNWGKLEEIWKTMLKRKMYIDRQSETNSQK